MSKMEEKIKLILDEKHIESQNKLNSQINGIFLFGFISGIIFSYSNIIGYIGGFFLGIIIRNNLSKKTEKIIENSLKLFCDSLEYGKKMLKID